jgi:predicted aspartyl protease
MPAIEAGFNDSGSLFRFGPTVYVQIGLDSTYRAEGQTPKLPNVNLPALVDTGATLSCIDSSLAARLRLPVVDRKSVIGVHGPVQTDFYAAQIYTPALKLVTHGIFAGLPLTSSGQLYYALIGRSFLKDFTMTYEGRTGRVTISN